jgi:aspartyl-tRNA(Asn)/glutamyl-tRNA(Gln) amidotransferase subunit A
VAAEVRTLIEDAAATLGKLGAAVRPARVPASVAAFNGITSMITATEGATLHTRWMRERPGDYGRQTLGRLLAGAMTPATTYIEAIAERPRLLAEFMETAFAEVDALIVPVMVMPVPTIAAADLAANPGFSDQIVRMGHATRPINYLGLPGLCVPCGFTANGLPAAFQLVGRPYDEATLYRLARAYERQTGCTDKAPDLSKIR